MQLNKKHEVELFTVVTLLTFITNLVNGIVDKTPLQDAVIKAFLAGVGALGFLLVYYFIKTKN